MEKHYLEEIVGDKIVDEKSIGGGDIADSRVVSTQRGSRYLLKQGIVGDNFRKEAEGLMELARPGCIRVPEVVHAGNDFLLLEYVAPGVKGPRFFDVFGRALARMHRFTGREFGFKHDNYIGTTAQINEVEGAGRHDWGTFYWEKRLLFQFRLCEKNGYADQQLSTLFWNLETIYPQLMAGSEEPPALLHGDLWGGNYLCDQTGAPVLIDPAVYYGHREADLGMTRLFGGFSREFYRAYDQEFPLKPGVEQREPLYLLYHVFNHLNLFGSGYYGQAVDLIKGLIRGAR
jgi:fructosamine-3-kinase